MASHVPFLLLPTTLVLAIFQDLLASCVVYFLHTFYLGMYWSLPIRITLAVLILLKLLPLCAERAHNGSQALS